MRLTNWPEIRRGALRNEVCVGNTRPPIGRRTGRGARAQALALIPLDSRPVTSDISVMTETTAKKKLPAAVERFILHWGDMGDEWGVNRSVSQIHGLLYLAEAPMTAEDIAETLGMARSNVSNSIKEL